MRTYADGAAALEGLNARPPDLAIFDIKMPRMDGMELLNRSASAAVPGDLPDLQGRGDRRGARPAHGRRRFHPQAVLPAPADRAHPRRAAPRRDQRAEGRGPGRAHRARRAGARSVPPPVHLEGQGGAPHGHRIPAAEVAGRAARSHVRQRRSASSTSSRDPSASAARNAGAPSRATSRNGPSGRGVNRSSQPPVNTVQCGDRPVTNARTSADFPIPASPVTSATPPAPGADRLRRRPQRVELRGTLHQLRHTSIVTRSPPVGENRHSGHSACRGNIGPPTIDNQSTFSMSVARSPDQRGLDDRRRRCDGEGGPVHPEHAPHRRANGRQR